MFFVLAHLFAFRPIAATHLPCVFPLLVDDTHIIGFASNVILVFNNCNKKI
jgi:hypothetical protein